jgi:hypothetical protein
MLEDWGKWVIIGLMGKWGSGFGAVQSQIKLPARNLEPEILKYLKTHDLMHPCT